MEQCARDLPVLAGGGWITAGVSEVAQREPRLGMCGLVTRGSGAEDSFAQKLLGLRAAPRLKSTLRKRQIEARQAVALTHRLGFVYGGK